MKTPTARIIHSLSGMLIAGFALSPAPRAAIIVSDSFETDGHGSRYTATGLFSDGEDDYFVRTDGATGPTGLPTYTNAHGDWFYAIEDSETTENTSSVARLDFTDLSITGVTQLQFAIDLAAGSTSAFDANEDFFRLEFQVDAGSWQPAIAAFNDGTAKNTMLRIDTDFDGIGDGTTLSTTFQSISSAAIPVAGHSLNVRIDLWSVHGDEAIAFDNLRVTSIPEPRLFTLLFGLCAFAPYAISLLKSRRN